MTNSSSFKVAVGISTLGRISQPRQGADRQMLGSALSLASKGVDVNVTNLMWGAPELEDADLVHLFNSGGPNGPYAQVVNLAKEKDIPVVTTPVYWPVDELKEEVEDIYGRQKKRYAIYLESFKPVLRKSDMLTPNSESEMEQVLDYLDVDELPYEVVPNAVNANIAFNDNDKPEVERVKDTDAPPWGEYVICPARIEPRKNQWRLVQAMKKLWDKGMDKKLVLMGGVKEDYISQFKDELEGENVILQPGDQHPEHMMSAIYHADLMVLPSFLETPGLVALEAAALGTNITVTDRGSTKEYFGDNVAYCNPLDTHSIADGIEDGLKQDQSRMTEIVLNKMTYDRVADLYIKLYSQMVN